MADTPILCPYCEEKMTYQRGRDMSCAYANYYWPECYATSSRYFCLDVERPENVAASAAQLAERSADQPAADMINHPPHYTYGKRECIDEMLAMFGPRQVLAHCRCAAYEYRYRAGHKGDPAQDLAKADWYIDKAAELMRGAQHEQGSTHTG